MPPDNDGVLELDHEVIDMATQAEAAHEQNMSQLMQTGIIAQNHFVGFTKLADYDYLEGHRLISLPQSLGAREVGSKQSPAGPTSAPAAA